MGLAGTSGWRKDMETSNVWTIINTELQKHQIKRNGKFPFLFLCQFWCKFSMKSLVKKQEKRYNEDELGVNNKRKERSDFL